VVSGIHQHYELPLPTAIVGCFKQIEIK